MKRNIAQELLEGIRAIKEGKGARRNDDAENESRIEITHAQMLAAQTPAEARAAFDRMRALIAQRSPQRVAQMERERGLV